MVKHVALWDLLHIEVNHYPNDMGAYEATHFKSTASTGVELIFNIYFYSVGLHV
jgi:hypothetical protein